MCVRKTLKYEEILEELIACSCFTPFTLRHPVTAPILQTGRRARDWQRSRQRRRGSASLSITDQLPLRPNKDRELYMALRQTSCTVHSLELPATQKPSSVFAD